jgi:hypothetical protein
MTNSNSMTAEQIAEQLKRLENDFVSAGITAAMAGCYGGRTPYYEKRALRAEQDLAAFKKLHGIS